MRINRKVILRVSLTILMVGGGFAAYRWNYPYGVRTCCLPCMDGALSAYAADHEGKFPDGAKTSQEALRKLIPSYLPTPSILAGITGDISMLEACLNRGEMVTDSVSSWVYFPGFRQDDDSNLAIIWERVAGVRFNGGRAPAGSHAVGFTDGSHRQIAASEWNSFLRDQATLRKAISERRAQQGRRAEPDGTANGSQPISSETNRTSGAAGSRR